MQRADMMITNAWLAMRFLIILEMAIAEQVNDLFEIIGIRGSNEG